MYYKPPVIKCNRNLFYMFNFFEINFVMKYLYYFIENKGNK